MAWQENNSDQVQIQEFEMGGEFSPPQSEKSNISIIEG